MQSAKGVFVLDVCCCHLSVLMGRFVAYAATQWRDMGEVHTHTHTSSCMRNATEPNDPFHGHAPPTNPNHTHQLSTHTHIDCEKVVVDWDDLCAVTAPNDARGSDGCSGSIRAIHS